MSDQPGPEMPAPESTPEMPPDKGGGPELPTPGPDIQPGPGPEMPVRHDDPGFPDLPAGPEIPSPSPMPGGMPPTVM